MKQGRVELKHLINIKRLHNLACIKEIKDGIWIGALTRLRTLELSPLIKKKLPILVEAIKTIGSVQIRNLGTVGGNICNASPSADITTPLIALDAIAHVHGKKGQIDYSIEEFFHGRGEIKLATGEFLTGVTVPHLPENSGSAFEKVGWTTFDIATVNVAAVVTLKENKIDCIRIGLGACSPAPTRVTAAEEALTGTEPTEENLLDATMFIAACVEPRERWRRAPPEYRRRSSQALAVDAISRAVENARRKT
jgi:carbon-monoxide dehydrogenase medium subunit